MSGLPTPANPGSDVPASPRGTTAPRDPGNAAWQAIKPQHPTKTINFTNTLQMTDPQQLGQIVLLQCRTNDCLIAVDADPAALTMADGMPLFAGSPPLPLFIPKGERLGVIRVSANGELYITFGAAIANP